MSQHDHAPSPLDDLARDAGEVAGFLEALAGAVPGIVEPGLLAYLKGLGRDPVGLAVLHAALQSVAAAQAPVQPVQPQRAGFARAR